MRTLKLTLEYDGTRYSGWQQQANARTVAGELNKAADDFFGRQIEIGGAGRTDAGVHAIAQVAHIKFPRGGASSAIVRGLPTPFSRSVAIISNASNISGAAALIRSASVSGVAVSQTSPHLTQT